MEPSLTVAGALLAGFATSFHCVGMCGPIICGLGTLCKSEEQRLTANTCYHGCRLASYAGFGAVCGAIGYQPLRWFFDSPAALLPWAIVIALIMLGFGLDKKIPRPLVFTKLTARARIHIRKNGPIASSSLMGLLTPFLPCGPLYVVFGIALLAGSPVKGSEITLAFGLGTVPLLWLAQHSFHKWRMRLSPLTMERLQRGLTITAAIIMAWRLHDTIPVPLGNQETTHETKELPSCCH